MRVYVRSTWYMYLDVFYMYIPRILTHCNATTGSVVCVGGNANLQKKFM